MINKYTILIEHDHKCRLSSVWLYTFSNNKWLEKTLIATIKKQDSERLEKVVKKLEELIGDNWEEEEFKKGREKASCSWEIGNMLDGFWYEDDRC